MKILIALTYYRPHISGLTIYAERLAKAFAVRGHEVTLMTAQFDKNLPAEEVVDGVKIVRVPVWFRISKGCIMPQFMGIARKLVRQSDAVLLHLPQFEAASVAFDGRRFKKPTVTTYHCDLLMPPGIISKLANVGIHMMNQFTGTYSNRIVTYTQDYADHSAYLRGFMNKVHIITPPVVLPEASSQEIAQFAKTHNPNKDYPVIGMAARFATEKGVEILLNALPEVLAKYPNAKVQFVGPYIDIIGEQDYLKRLMPTIEKYQQSGNWEFVGSLQPKQMAAFYPNLDVLVLPSLNSTEAFGLVQIEAMMNGVPCVASNLPGVRQPVKVHNMGRIFEIGDSKGCATAILEVLETMPRVKNIDCAQFDRYSPDYVASEYEKLFLTIQAEIDSKKH